VQENNKKTSADRQCSIIHSINHKDKYIQEHNNPKMQKEFYNRSPLNLLVSGG